MRVEMAGQKTTNRQKDISRLLRGKKKNLPQKLKKNNTFSEKSENEQKGFTKLNYKNREFP